MSLPPAEPVDLDNCAREPIHQLGAIQPIGFLIASTPEWRISRVSANIADFLDVTPDEALGMGIVDLFCGEAVHALRNRLSLLRDGDSIERVYGCQLRDDGRRFDIALHMSDGLVVVEGEPSTEHHYGDMTGTVRAMVSRLDLAPDLDAFFNEGARQVRALTGFDRVMVYRFDPDGSGHVVGESARGGIGSFLGLHYPPSDIPHQARELYKRSLLRVITDVDAAPVAVVPTLDAKGAPLDLSLSVLRSVSPIHIEYLRNMGVRASMSVSIIVDGALWGLIACHHHSPRCPSFERRSVAELFAQMFAMRIESRERKLLVDYEHRARDVSDQLLGAALSPDMLIDEPGWLADVLTRAISADGVGIFVDGRTAFSGLTPDAAEFARIVAALRDAPATRVTATERISTLVPQAASHAGQAAGMLAIPLSRAPGDYVILFRAEVVRSVRWGGDPHKPSKLGPNGPRLTPRESFAEWKELVEGSSIPFSPSEIRVAETLRATLIGMVVRAAAEGRASRPAPAKRQDLLVAELNHRVRNILGLIRGLVRQSRPAPGGSVDDYAATLDGRIESLARAHNQITDDFWGPAPLRRLVEAEVAAFVDPAAKRVSIAGAAILLTPLAYSTMAMVVHELLTNSARYGALSAAGTVAVNWSRDAAGDLVVEWREDGGPAVTAPTRRGFGTTIIEQSVPHELGGQASLDFRAAGVEARFVIPGAHIAEVDQAAAGAEPPRAAASEASATGDLLSGKRVLLVEDNLIIALDAEDILHRLGAREVIADRTVAGALAAIDAARPDLAILDINLGDCDSFPIADRLDAAGVPFLFASGYGDQAVLGEPHRHRAVIQKPYSLDALASGLAALTPR